MLSFLSILGLTATTGNAVVSCYQKHQTTEDSLLSIEDWNLVTNILKYSKTLKINSSLTFQNVLKNENGIVFNYLEEEIFPIFKELSSKNFTFAEIEQKISLFKKEIININYCHPDYDFRRDDDGKIIESSFSYDNIKNEKVLNYEIKKRALQVGMLWWYGMDDFTEIKKYMTISIGIPKIIISEDETKFYLESPFLNIEWEDKNGN